MKWLQTNSNKMWFFYKPTYSYSEMDYLIFKQMCQKLLVVRNESDQEIS